MANKHKVQIILSPILFFISHIYRIIMLIRNKLYALKILHTYKPCLPTISVGNVSWGGTGKSPIVGYLINFLRSYNAEPLVITRGYGKKFADYPVLLNNKTLNSIPLKEQGKVYPDEALMLLAQHEDLDIIIDPKRARAAKAYADNVFDVSPKKYFVLDDGFSHMGIARDFDLVLLDKADLMPKNFGNFFSNNWNKIIPLGTWRESQTALVRAKAFLLKCPRSEWETLSKSAKNRLEKYKKPLFVFEMASQGVYNIFTHEPFCSENQTSYALVCAVGNPWQVQKSLEDYLNYKANSFHFLPDHHDYAADESFLENILTQMSIICTEKDAVKLVQFEKFRHTKHSIYVLKSEASFYASVFYGLEEHTLSSDFENWLTKKLIL